jgi:hypothetical protein
VTRKILAVGIACLIPLAAQACETGSGAAPASVEIDSPGCDVPCNDRFRFTATAADAPLPPVSMELVVCRNSQCLNARGAIDAGCTFGSGPPDLTCFIAPQMVNVDIGSGAKTLRADDTYDIRLTDPATGIVYLRARGSSDYSTVRDCSGATCGFASIDATFSVNDAIAAGAPDGGDMNDAADGAD